MLWTPSCPTFSDGNFFLPGNSLDQFQKRFQIKIFFCPGFSRYENVTHTAQVTNDPPLVATYLIEIPKNCRSTAARPFRYRLLIISLDRHLECSPLDRHLEYSPRSSPRKHRRLVSCLQFSWKPREVR